MEYRNCPRCGAIFAYVSSPVCKKCEQDEEDVLNQLKEYVIANPGSNIYDIAKATGINDRRIFKFIREERFELVKPEGPTGIDCERCGKPITKGRFCENCLVKYHQEVADLFPKDSPSIDHKNAKMHTYKKDRRR